MELDPLYVDVAIRRWQQLTGERAIHAASGKSFAEMEAEACAAPAPLPNHALVTDAVAKPLALTDVVKEALPESTDAHIAVTEEEHP